ncbi:hypothetical protein KDL29_03890 [bacterium]|nr:hypothetical protein [bacterium]
MKRNSSKLIDGLSGRISSTQRYIHTCNAIGGGLLLLGIIHGLDALDPAGPRQRSLELQLCYLLFGAALGLGCGALLDWLLQIGMRRHARRHLLDNLLLPQLFDSQVREESEEEQGSGDLNLPLGKRRHALLTRLERIASNWDRICAELGQPAMPLALRLLWLASFPLAVAVPVTAFLTGQILLMFALGGFIALWKVLAASRGNAVRHELLSILQSIGNGKMYSAKPPEVIARLHTGRQ